MTTTYEIHEFVLFAKYCYNYEVKGKLGMNREFWGRDRRKRTTKEIEG
jgi:hypothetical protein